MERPDSRLIRVFLSSTFVDFQEERSLLVQQVFPSLRRRARSREVEIVDVDLRWGVTAEQTEQGETLPLCLGEIDRCRPYFISLLGERYGWVPPPDYYKPELLERQPWLKERMGGASVTELEILHGVLRNPEMAGHAFFYLRDPAYALAQSEAGWVAESPAERQKLEALKAQIRASGFPVAEGLPTPKAIAERIEADLWQLIESQFPEQEPADALERVGRRHSDYRRSRTGLYLGGGPAIDQLERWITEGEQRILITGESGAGKSALIANWLEAHQRSHPQDLVHAHHLGCTNDASAVRPLLARLIDTASKLLLQEQQISEAIQVPQDWWELVFKVGEVFALLSPWCERQGRRWILVLDGLDRLAEDDQRALPWISTTIPPGIHVVASALDCPARTILQERQYRTHEIGPLGKAEQQQLIERYLSRYTKQLENGLQQRILAHPLADSPLFLRVLLEELRQCACFDTLQEQVEFYLSAETIDGLYAKVLERLERDGHGEAVRRVMTALWASRAGLSEEELLAITGLAPLQWAPVELALAQAFGRNGDRLVFDHDFLRKAVESGYLPSEEEQKLAHVILADWYQNRDGWDERDSHELPWQLQQAGLLEDLREWLLIPTILADLQWDCGSREVVNYWLTVKAEGEGELDEQIAEEVQKEIEGRKGNPGNLIWFVDRIADLLNEAGLYRDLLLRLRTLSLEFEDAAEDRDEGLMLTSLALLASAHQDIGDYATAESLYQHCLEVRERLLGPEHPSTLATIGNLGLLYSDKGEYEQAESYLKRCLVAEERLLGPEHPSTLTTTGNLGLLYSDKGEYEQAESYLKRCLVAEERLLGPEHFSTLTTIRNLGSLYQLKGDYEQAESFYIRDLEASERLLGPEHPSTLATIGNLGLLYSKKGDYEQAESYLKRCLVAEERLLGPEHPSTLTTINNLGNLYQLKGDYEQAESFYIRNLEASERLLGPEHPSTLTAIGNLAALYQDKGEYEQAESFYIRDLEASERLLGPEHPSTLTTIGNLGNLFRLKGDYEQAEACYIRDLEASERLLGPEHPSILITIGNLGLLYSEKGDYEQAESYLRRCLVAEERLLGPEHPSTLTTIGNLGLLYSKKGDYEQAESYLKRCLVAEERLLGPEHPSTLTTINNLGNLYQLKGDYEQAESFYIRNLEASERLLGPEHPSTLTAIGNLAALYQDKGEYEQAESFYIRNLEASERLLGPEHPSTLTTINNLGNLYQLKGDYEQAESFYIRNLEASERLLGPEHPSTLTTISNLGLLYSEKGDYEQAESYLKRCLVAEERLLGPEHPSTLTTAYNLAQLLSALDRQADAIPLRRRELAWCRQQNSEMNHDTLHSLNELAIDLRAIGELEESEALFRELLSARQQALEPRDSDNGRAMSGLAKTLKEAGKLDEALDYAQQALAHRLEHEGPDSLSTNRERLELAQVLHKLSREEEALSRLNDLQASLSRLADPEESVQQLLAEAKALRQQIKNAT